MEVIEVSFDREAERMQKERALVCLVCLARQECRLLNMQPVPYDLGKRKEYRRYLSSFQHGLDAADLVQSIARREGEMNGIVWRGISGAYAWLDENN